MENGPFIDFKNNDLSWFTYETWWFYIAKPHLFQLHQLLSQLGTIAPQRALARVEDGLLDGVLSEVEGIAWFQ